MKKLLFETDLGKDPFAKLVGQQLADEVHADAQRRVDRLLRANWFLKTVMREAESH
jgi:hypothetical protein